MVRQAAFPCQSPCISGNMSDTEASNQRRLAPAEAAEFKRLTKCTGQPCPLQASVCVVVALAALLPAVLSAALLLSELAFGLVAAPVRYHQLDKKQHRAGQATGEDEDEHSWLQDGLRVLHQLLDPREGHAELLRSDGTSWFKGWWSDELQASQLGRSNVTQFLAYILFSSTQLGGKANHLLHVMSDTFISAMGLDVGAAHNPRATFVSHTEVRSRERRALVTKL